MLATLEEIKQAIAELTPAERAELRIYLEQVESPPAVNGLSPEERARRLDAAFEQFREGLTPEQLEEMTEAMNEEYIEPWDENEWKD